MAHFSSEQKINTSLQEAWAFFSNPHNLKKVSPKGAGFDVLNEIPNELTEDTIIEHRFYPIPFISSKWVSKILEVNHPVHFIDQQQKGPFAFWEHKHSFEEVKDGIMVRDEIEFELPLGGFGKIFEFLALAKIKSSFRYRRKKLDQIFNL